MGSICCPENTYGVDHNDGKKACCPSPTDVPISDEYPCCPEGDVYVISVADDDAFGGSYYAKVSCSRTEGKKVYRGKSSEACCFVDDVNCICKVDPNNEICEGGVCPVDSVYCDEETGKCEEVTE